MNKPPSPPGVWGLCFYWGGVGDGGGGEGGGAGARVAASRERGVSNLHKWLASRYVDTLHRLVANACNT